MADTCRVEAIGIAIRTLIIRRPTDLQRVIGSSGAEVSL